MLPPDKSRITGIKWSDVSSVLPWPLFWGTVVARGYTVRRYTDVPCAAVHPLFLINYESTRSGFTCLYGLIGNVPYSAVHNTAQCTVHPWYWFVSPIFRYLSSQLPFVESKDSNRQWWLSFLTGHSRWRWVRARERESHPLFPHVPRTSGQRSQDSIFAHDANSMRFKETRAVLKTIRNNWVNWISWGNLILVPIERSGRWLDAGWASTNLIKRRI